jgi:hypothetical protein
MDTAGCEPHAAVLAIKVKGEASCAPFEGAATVIADAETALPTKARKAKKIVFI